MWRAWRKRRGCPPREFPGATGAPRALAALLLGVLCAAGCADPPIASYRVRKEAPPRAAAAEPPADGPGSPLPSRAWLQWKLPAGWREISPGPMGIAKFSARGHDGAEAQVGVTVTPSIAGHEADIVNLLREHLGLARLGDDRAGMELGRVRVGEDAGGLFDAATEPGDAGGRRRVVAAIVHRDDASWLYMLTGDAGAVESAKPAFLRFLESVRIVRPAAAPPASEETPRS